MFLIFGLVFHPAFLSAAEPAPDAAAKKAADAVVAEEDAGADLDAGDKMDDWELGKDDLAAEDEDLKLDDEEETAAKDAKAPAAAPVAAAKKAQ